MNKKVVISVVVLAVVGIFAGRLLFSKKSQKPLTSPEQWEQKIMKQLENKEFHKPVDLPIADQEKLKSSCKDFFSAITENELAAILARPEWEYYREDADSLKELVDHIAEVTIGEPFKVDAFSFNIFVPYKLRFKNGHVKEWQVGIRYYDENGEALPSWYIDGGI
ncbi:MAG: hypothetical protein KJ887_00035 [Candidatus Omnitrophica bacterium]|nr:hypothetical protein [Candidatus Omnitrophota bacterium]MBU1631435.1 hypothetical protein [Candidatus Omnitrophota bacterium]MBU1767396.1 hypothetical protein [Candidatus Omnitrophota bacterium]MBU1889830.1 hypothetical protein [Candidatus Omnitrophota bacterium]